MRISPPVRLAALFAAVAAAVLLALGLFVGDAIERHLVSMEHHDMAAGRTDLLRFMDVFWDSLLGLVLVATVAMGAIGHTLARLREAHRKLSDFSVDLAHELRTPVSNLMTQTQVVLSKPRSAGEYRDVLASNAEELDRLARMIADMLFLAQADHGLIVPNREPVDLAREMRALFDFYEVLAEERGIQLSLLEGEAEGTVVGDRLMLRRAMGNLLANALRHTPDSGVVRVRIGTDDRGTTLAVENDGDPIPPEHLPRLFDRFYRADPSRHGEGTGLGLAIVRSIVRAHGGEIGVRCGDAGVCFEIRMPRAS